LNNSGYAKAAKILWDLAIKAKDQNVYYPIWGTCLGFELLTVLASVNNTRLLTNCSSEDVAMNLDFNKSMKDFTMSNLFKNADSSIVNVIITKL